MNGYNRYLLILQTQKEPKDSESRLHITQDALLPSGSSFFILLTLCQNAFSSRFYNPAWELTQQSII